MFDSQDVNVFNNTKLETNNTHNNIIFMRITHKRNIHPYFCSIRVFILFAIELNKLKIGFRLFLFFELELSTEKH